MEEPLKIRICGFRLSTVAKAMVDPP